MFLHKNVFNTRNIINLINKNEKKGFEALQLKKKDDWKTPLVGLEPTTYGLEVHRAIQLRYRGLGL